MPAEYIVGWERHECHITLSIQLLCLGTYVNHVKLNFAVSFVLFKNFNKAEPFPDADSRQLNNLNYVLSSRVYLKRKKNSKQCLFQIVHIAICKKRYISNHYCRIRFFIVCLHVWPCISLVITVKSQIQDSPWQAIKLLITQPAGLPALLQLHLYSQLNTWFQWIGQRHMQDETRDIYVWGLGAFYIRDGTVSSFVLWK